MLFREDDAKRFVEAMKNADVLRMSVATWFEAAIVIDRRGDKTAQSRFDQIIARMEIQLHPLTLEHVLHARDAWHAFGRGSKHGARLNFGDCLSYGFSKANDEPLLFKGNDFAKTDITPALKA